MDERRLYRSSQVISCGEIADCVVDEHCIKETPQSDVADITLDVLAFWIESPADLEHAR